MIHGMSEQTQGAPSLEEMQKAARFRGVFPPFPENVSRDDLAACAEYRGIDVDEADDETALTLKLVDQLTG